MTLMDNKFSKIISHENYFEFIWSTETENMIKEQYEGIMLEYADLAEKYKPTKLLLDIVDNKFPISPEIQEWTDQNIFARTHKAGLKKDAILISKDILAQMSVEQLFDEKNVNEKQTNFFDTKEAALKWLLND